MKGRSNNYWRWLNLGIALGIAATAGAGAPSEKSERDTRPAPESARDFYNAGTRQLADRKLKEAEAYLENAVSLQVDEVQAPALYNLGLTRFLQGDDERKKGPEAGKALNTANATLGWADRAIHSADEALRSKMVQKLITAYLGGRGARRELKAAAAAVKRAMDAHSATLQKWQRALGDFQSAEELHPSLDDARHNAEVTQRHIARLVDSLKDLQAMAAMLGEKQEDLKQKMKQLKGQIPEEDMPPGATGDDEEEEDKQNGPEEGQKEAASKSGEMNLTPEQAAWLLEGYRLDSERRLPMGQNSQSDPRKKARRDW
jgi:tetratricopeptide (TPR) repeat protein